MYVNRVIFIKMKKKELINLKQINVEDYGTRLKDLDWAFGLNRLSLLFMGVWPEETNEKLLSSKIFPMFIRTPSMIMSIFCFLFLPQAYAINLVSNNLLLILDNFMTSGPAFTSCIKLFIFWRNSKVLKPVVKTVTEDWLRPKMEWEYEVMRKEAVLAKFFTVVGYAIGGCAYLAYALAPIFGLNFRMVSNITDYGKRHLLVQSYYPYDYAKSTNYELTHLSQVIGGSFLIMAMAIPDNYFGALVFHLSAQYKILGLSIENLIQINNNTEIGLKKSRLIFNKKLAVYVNRHVHLIRMVSLIEKTFNFVILMQIFCLCVMVCIIGLRILYLIKMEEEHVSVLEALNLGAAMLAMMLFTLADCSASETLATHSETLLYHIYNCNWYMAPEQDIRKLIFIMFMSKNPQLLTAGKVMPLSIATYCSILKTIAGYISVLIAVST